MQVFKFLKVYCCMLLIAATRAEGGLVLTAIIAVVGKGGFWVNSTSSFHDRAEKSAEAFREQKFRG